MVKTRIIALLLLLVGAGIGYFTYTTEIVPSQFAFKYGLDLAGGTHIVYSADTSDVASGDVGDAMNSLRDVIERRVNLFGVSEPVVQVERGGVGSNGENRLIVELPGITNLQDAIGAIGKTPSLDFRLERTIGATTTYEATGLTGQYLENAQLQFGTGGPASVNTPVILLNFTAEGAELFISSCLTLLFRSRFQTERQLLPGRSLQRRLAKLFVT
jgi:preprotein translocase subunit SecD